MTCWNSVTRTRLGPDSGRGSSERGLEDWKKRMSSSDEWGDKVAIICASNVMSDLHRQRQRNAEQEEEEFLQLNDM